MSWTVSWKVQCLIDRPSNFGFSVYFCPKVVDISVSIVDWVEATFQVDDDNLSRGLNLIFIIF